jgi:endonuclease/exonuclease/phosphatase family metal-dependent hydrolase
MKRLIAVVACLWLAAGAPALADPRDNVRVMTRNVYLGADLQPILAATTPAEFGAAVQSRLAQIAATNFPERARALADEIAERRPHLVGLQEVYRFTLNGATGAPPFRDALADLQEALAELGADYYVAAEVHNLNVTIPLLPTANVVQAIDRDVILARGDVVASPVIVPGCRTSQDGCNFNVGASLQSPFGPIAIERGFVLVDAIVDGHSVRFVNTHLEIPELPLVLQAAQATELIGRLAALPNTSASPVILVGDINSAPTDQPTVVGGMTIVPPYVQLTQAGYIDTWPLRPGNPPGLTCCEAENLLNPALQHHKRIDLVFSSVVPIGVRASVLGADPEDKTPSGLWPSDHAGVFARLLFDQ